MKDNARKFMTFGVVLMLVVQSALAISCRANTKNNVSQDENESVFSGRSIEGYYVSKDIVMFASMTTQTPMKTKLRRGNVCIKSQYEENGFEFPHLDCVERLVVGSPWVKYYEPSQDDVKPHYIKRATFDQSAQKKQIYLSAPSTWNERETYTFVPEGVVVTEFMKISITPIVIKDPSATMKQWIDQTYTKTKKVSMKDVMVYKLSLYYKYDGGSEPVVCYVWDGQQFAKNNTDDNGEFVDDFSNQLEINDAGYCQWVKENGRTYPTSELGPIEGEFPILKFLGWLDQDKVVLDNAVFVIKKQ